MIHFKCSKCGEGMEAPESLRGKSLQCPECGLHEEIPTPPERPTRATLLPIWLIAIIAVSFLTAGVIIGIVFNYHKYNKGEKALNSETSFELQRLEENDITFPKSIFDMNKEQFLAYCRSKNIEPKAEEYFNTPTFTHFVTELPAFSVTWRRLEGNLYIDSILIGNMQAETSIEGAKPVWELWGILQPDIPVLFQHLWGKTTRQGTIDSRLKWYQNGPYAYGYGANNKFYVKYIGPKSAIPELQKQSVECAIIYLSWFDEIKTASDVIDREIKSGISNVELTRLLIKELSYLEDEFSTVDIIVDFAEEYSISDLKYFYSNVPPNFHEKAKGRLMRTAGALEAIARLARHQLKQNKLGFNALPEMVIALSLTGGNAYQEIAGRYSRLEGFTHGLPEKYEKQLSEISTISFALMTTPTP